MEKQMQQIKERALVVQTIRNFFDQMDFVEVDTPVAIPAPIPEAHIDAPLCILHCNGLPHRIFLQPSPESSMKKLLALDGLERIYQIAPVFREHDHSNTHLPEFRMLEWYRKGETWEKLLEDTESLIRKCAEVLNLGEKLSFGARTIDLSRPFRQITVDEAFQTYLGFAVSDYLEPEPLRAQLTRQGIAFDDDFETLFHRAFLSRVEPKLVESDQPFFLTHYPAPLAALARLAPANLRVSERFELYVGGLELANGFGELTDVQEQAKRFAKEKRERQALGKTCYPDDPAFLRALDRIQSAAGNALGLDRLLMVLSNTTHIQDTWAIPPQYPTT